MGIFNRGSPEVLQDIFLKCTFTRVLSLNPCPTKRSTSTIQHVKKTHTIKYIYVLWIIIYMVWHQRLLQILSKASDVLMMVSLLLVHKKMRMPMPPVPPGYAFWLMSRLQKASTVQSDPWLKDLAERNWWWSPAVNEHSHGKPCFFNNR